MKITVGIPVYNRKTKIKACIDSVLNQEISENDQFSVLVVDNNSNDGTKEILKSYETNNKVEIVYNEENLGMAGNWTKVFNVADSEYIFLLHSDDLLNKGTLHKVFDFLNTNPDCDFGFGNVDIVSDKNTRKNIFSLKNKGNELLDNDWLLNNYYYKASHPCPPQTWFIKKGIIEEMGGFIDKNMCCDFNMSFKIVASNYKIGYINSSLTKWMIHDENVGGGDIRKHKNDLLKAIDDLYEQQEKFSLDSNKMNEIKIWVEKEELLKYLKIGDKKGAKEKIKSLSKKYFDLTSFKELLMLVYKYVGLNLVKPFFKVKVFLDTI